VRAFHRALRFRESTCCENVFSDLVNHITRDKMLKGLILISGLGSALEASITENNEIMSLKCRTRENPFLRFSWLIILLAVREAGRRGYLGGLIYRVLRILLWR